MTYECWPDTSVQIPSPVTGEGCCPCIPGYDLLFGPGRDSRDSHIFNVNSRPVVVRAVGIKAFPAARVRLQMIAESCGEVVYEDVCLDGVPCELSPATNVLTITASGRYRMVMTGAEPDDFTVTQAPTSTGMTMGKDTRI